MAWTVRPAGEWSVAISDDPAVDMPAALALPQTWRWNDSLGHIAYVHKDQVANLVPSGPVTPPPVAGYTCWYDAAQIAGTADGAPLATWPDLSGHGNDAAQATPGQQPVYQASPPSVSFDGVDDVLASASFPAPQAQPITVVAAWGCAGPNTGGGNPAEYAVGSDDYFIVGIATPDVWMLYDGNEVDGSTPAPMDGSVHVQVGVFDGATTAQFVDGAAEGSADSGGGTQSNIRLGDGVYGTLAEVIVYPTALSTADRQSVEAYLKAKWGTP